MAQKEDLKELLEQYFPDNNTGEITEPKVREFLGKVIDLIPEIAGGDLTGTFPNPTIGANKIDATKIAYKTLASDQIAAGGLDDGDIFADETIGARVLERGAVDSLRLAQNEASCVIAATQAISISSVFSIPLTNIVDYQPAFGYWTTRAIDVQNATSPNPTAQLIIACNSAAIDQAKFATMPAIIPILVFSSGDTITVDVQVYSEFNGRTSRSDNIKLYGQGGYVSLILAKTSTGYFLMGSNNLTDF